MFTLDVKSATPIFEQIVQQVGKFIALEILNPHDQLPTVRALAKELGINPNTVAKAYHECEMSGMIYSIAGKGSFVSERDNIVKPLVDQAYSMLNESVQRLLDLGESYESIVNYIQEDLL